MGEFFLLKKRAWLFPYIGLQGRVMFGKTLMLHPKGVEILASKEKSGISVFYTFLVAQFIMVGIAVVIICEDNTFRFSF